MTEKMSKQEREGMNERANDQLRHVEVRRFLNRMPLFKLDEHRSDRFDDLLARLDASDPLKRGH